MNSLRGALPKATSIGNQRLLLIARALLLTTALVIALLFLFTAALLLSRALLLARALLLSLLMIIVIVGESGNRSSSNTDTGDSADYESGQRGEYLFI